MQRGVTVSLMFHYNEPFLRNKKKKTKKQRRQWDQKKREINVPISDVVKYIKKQKELQTGLLSYSSSKHQQKINKY